MCDLQQWISQYLLDCQYQKGLDPKTIKAYRIDLAQFLELAGQKNFKFTRNEIMAYISRLHQQYKPKTIRRKIASIKAFFGYLEYEGLVQENPFSKLRIKLAIPVILPRTIPLSVISSILAIRLSAKGNRKVTNTTGWNLAGYRCTGTPICNRSQSIRVVHTWVR